MSGKMIKVKVALCICCGTSMLEFESHGRSCGGVRKCDVRTDVKAKCQILKAVKKEHQINELTVLHEWQKMQIDKTRITYSLKDTHTRCIWLHIFVLFLAQ